jgi:hypothetical protein
MQDRLKDLSRETLIDLLVEQIRINQELRQEISVLREENKRLRRRIEELERQVNRQAAPFRIPDQKRKLSPAPPGRKAGHPGFYRQMDREQLTDTIEVGLPHCPHCKGSIGTPKKIEQIIEDIPVVRKEVYKIITYTGKCARCGVVSSTHPLQTSQATGAAAVQIGPGAKALAVSLQYEYGMTKRKTCKLLDRLFQLRMTPGGLVYSTHRTAEKMENEYESLTQQLRNDPVVHSDETSWYVGSPKYWLWVFANKNSTVYRVSSSRGREVITTAIGTNYQGTLVSDCLSIYDEASPLQHKCYSHHLKAIRQAREKTESPEQVAYLSQLSLLLKTAMAVKEVKMHHPPDIYQKLCRNLEIQADRLILPEQTGMAEKVANRLRKQRDHLFTFLYHDEVDATNNLAERQLRPAVISRKISCGNRTAKGAQTYQILASIAATSNQLNLSFQNKVKEAIALNS